MREGRREGEEGGRDGEEGGRKQGEGRGGEGDNNYYSMYEQLPGQGSSP